MCLRTIKVNTYNYFGCYLTEYYFINTVECFNNHYLRI